MGHFIGRYNRKIGVCEIKKDGKWISILEIAKTTKYVIDL